MKKSALRGQAILLAFIALLCGCPYESKVSLTDSKDSNIDDRILGKWSSQQFEKLTFEVFRFNNNEYLIVITEDDNKRVAFNRAFISKIKGHNILNLSELTHKQPQKPFIFARYWIEGGMLKVKMVDESIFGGRKFKDRKSFYKFVETHWESEGLFGQSGIASSGVAMYVFQREK